TSSATPPIWRNCARPTGWHRTWISTLHGPSPDMNPLRLLTLLVCCAILAGCAGKTVRGEAPATVAVVPPPASAPQLPDTVEENTRAGTPPAANAAQVPTDASDSDAAVPTGAEDDFAALYGGTAPTADGDTGNPATGYDPW